MRGKHGQGGGFYLGQQRPARTASMGRTGRRETLVVGRIKTKKLGNSLNIQLQNYTHMLSWSKQSFRMQVPKAVFGDQHQNHWGRGGVLKI